MGLVAEAFGRDVSFAAVTPDEYVAEAVAAGLPEEEARPLAEMFAQVLDGRNAWVGDGVQQALGRPARDFAAYARTAAASGAWEG